MVAWMVSLLALTIFGYVVSRIKIYICLEYRRQVTNDFLAVNVKLLQGLLAYSLEIPTIELISRSNLPWLKTKLQTADTSVNTHADREQRFVANTADIYRHHPAKWRHIVREFIYYLRLYKKFARSIQRNISCERFYWRTSFGNDDSAVTGMIVGLFWILKSEIFLLLRRRLKSSVAPVLKVSPVYNAKYFEVEFQCIFTIRVGNVINAVLGLIWLIFTKEGKVSE